MAGLTNKRAIVDRRALGGEIGALAPDDRAAVLDRLKGALEAGRAEVRRRFDAGADGPTTAAGLALLADRLIAVLFDHAAGRVFPEPNPTAADRLALVAVGGYGRGELAPFSDVDLLFLTPYKTTPRGEQIVEYILYMLWDLGLTVGQAMRSVNESLARSRRDVTIRTALLESRFVYGDQALYLELKKGFAKDAEAGGRSFVAAKLGERDERHARMGDSRYVVEPNLKDGKGGLRDLHTLFWIAKYLYRVEDVSDLVGRGVLTRAEFRMFRRAHRFLWTVRCRLHYLSGRAEERLTFDSQLAVAEAAPYAGRAGRPGVERFMKHYYLIAKTVGDLTRIFCAAIESEHVRRPLFSAPRWGLGRRAIEGFRVEHGRVGAADDDAFERNPVDMLRLFHVAQSRGLDVHPRALRAITRSLPRIDARLRADPQANRLFMEMLTGEKDPETTLRRLNEAGVLGRFIPDFGRVVAQTQHDMYHVYTVDEHTIFAIGVLSRIEKGALAEELPLATEIVHEVLSRKALYLALFLHDIAKGRGGDHSLLGAGVARKLAPRLGCTAEETETVAWLVEHHLLCSTTAFNRDISDPRTLETFVAAVQSPQRLRLLLVLTVADIRAVGPNVWNGWKGQLLRGLYYRAEAAMTGGGTLADRKERLEAAKAALREALADRPREEVDRFIDRWYPDYLLGFNAGVHVRHAALTRRADAEGAPLTVETRVDAFRSVTEVTVYAPDHPGLFAGVAGAMTACGATIVDARIFGARDGMVIDTFRIQDMEGRAFDGPARLARLSATVEMTLADDFKPRAAIAEREEALRASRLSVFKVAPRVLVDNRASATRTVIEINARDRAGLLFDLARALVGLRLALDSARIATWGERAVDVFYVKDAFGMKVTDENRLARVKETLLAAARGGAAVGAADAAAAE